MSLNASTVYLLITITVIIFFKFSRPPKGSPPGVWGIPFLGSIPYNGLTRHIRDLTQKYGPIFQMKLGSRVFVVLSDFDLIKSAFTNPNIQGRPDFYSFGIFKNFQNLGIAISNGGVWKSGRKFAIRHLRDFGMGKTSLEYTIQEEARALVDDLGTFVGKPIEPSWNINVAVLNIIWKLVADRRYKISDKQIQGYMQMTLEDFDTIQGPIALLDIMPWIIPFVPRIIKNKWMKVNQLEDSRERLNKLFMPVIEDHLATLDPSNPRDYIDKYLLEIEKQQNVHNSLFKPDYSDLLACLDDLFSAGSETTSTTLRWFILFMVIHQDVQLKIQEEIDNVVPRNRLPALEDRENLQYLEAVIHEVHRKASILKLGLAHSTSMDTTIGEYYIPKDSIILANVEFCHNCSLYWDHPDEFCPNHFLNDEGKVQTKKAGFLPFSIGRRQCLGETLARDELFLFSCSILQNFNIRAPENSMPSLETDDNDMFNFVKPYKIVLENR